MEFPQYYYKATIQYDGTGYAGFQWQKDIPSVQNDFNLALKTLVEGKITTMSASRTDTGVHAIDQVVKITSQYSIDTSSFLPSFNQTLPAQIKCLEIVPCKGEFKPASDPISKEYRYYFTNQRSVQPEDRRFVANFPLELDFDLMKECLKEILGTHDFRNFCSAGSNVKSTIRTIHFCELSEINPQTIFLDSHLFQFPQHLLSCYQLKIEGNGFLKQMIRHLMSGLWMVGSGRITKADFIHILNGPLKEKRLWKVAAPNGLFLYKITYPE